MAKSGWWYALFITLSRNHQSHVPALTGNFADLDQGDSFSRKSAKCFSWGGGYRGKGCDGAGSDPDPDEAGCFPFMGCSAGNDEMVPASFFYLACLHLQVMSNRILNKGRNSLTLPSFMQYLHISSRLVRKLRNPPILSQGKINNASGGFRSFWRVNIYTREATSMTRRYRLS